MIEYVLHVSIMVCCYAIVAIALDLLAGHTGLVSLAQAAFFGLGAYSSAFLAVHLGASFIVCLVVCMVVAGAASFVVSLPSLRLHDDYFVIATFGLQLILYTVFLNWQSVTGGPMGISGIPLPTLLGWQIDSKLEFLALVASLGVIVHVLAQRVAKSPFGLVLRAIREDDVFAESVGKDTWRFKVAVFGFSAIITATAGSVYAHYMSYIDPTSFTAIESILILSMVIVGGAASRWGPWLGAAILVSLPEALRFVGLPTGLAANLRQILYGVLLVIMMVARPRGLVGRYGFSR